VLSQIEGVIGSPHNDLITGSNASLETFRPAAGNDTVNAGGGDDLLRFDASSSAVTVVFTAPGTGTASGQGDDVFTGVEAIVGSSGNDTVVGSSGEELLRGNAGNDSLDGGAGGGDRADYRSAGAGVVVSLLTNRASGGDGTTRWPASRTSTARSAMATR
jgi:Ca2+-binding RTX toxin-like protein